MSEDTTPEKVKLSDEEMASMDHLPNEVRMAIQREQSGMTGSNSDDVRESQSGHPSESINLPSRGHFYPEGHPLSSGEIDMHYMTAKHEDILTSSNLMKKGLAIDTTMKALIATKGIKYDDILLIDKDAIMIAARIMGYGKDYQTSIRCPSCRSVSEVSVDLETMEPTETDIFDEVPRGTNEFTFITPVKGDEITWKLLTIDDDRKIDVELKRLKKVNKGGVQPEMTTRMIHSITSFNGMTKHGEIRQEVAKMLSRDSLAFRQHIVERTPSIDMTFWFSCPECSYEGVTEVPFGPTFFWPESRV